MVEGMAAPEPEEIEVIEGATAPAEAASGANRRWLWLLAVAVAGLGGWLVGRASSEPGASDARVRTGVSITDLVAEPVRHVEVDRGHVDALTLVGGGSERVSSNSTTPLWLILRDGQPLALLDRSPFRGCRLVYEEDVTATPRGFTQRIASPTDGFVDPCHGAVFSTAGAFVDGPVEMRGLDRFAAGIAPDGEIVVDVSDLRAGPAAEPAPEVADENGIEVTREVRALTGTVVVAPAPGGGGPPSADSEVHVLTNFRHATRQGVPLRPGDDRYPLLFHDGWMVLAGQNGGVYRLHTDATGIQRVSDGDAVLAHTEPGWAWVVSNIGWVAPLEIATGHVGPRHNLRWDPVVGTNYGLVVRLDDGNLGFWTAELGVVALPEAGGGQFLAATPRNYAVLTGSTVWIVNPDLPGPELRVDLPTESPGFSTRNVIAAFSPDTRLLVLAASPSPGRSGGLAILDTSTGDVEFMFYGDPHDYTGMTWISDSQFVALRRDASGTDMVTIETEPSLRLRTVARLSGPLWWLAQNV